MLVSHLQALWPLGPGTAALAALEGNSTDSLDLSGMGLRLEGFAPLAEALEASSSPRLAGIPLGSTVCCSEKCTALQRHGATDSEVDLLRR